MTAGAAQHQPLQQCKPFTRRTIEDRLTCVCTVLRQAIQVREELLPCDVAFVMRWKVHAPLRHCHPLRMLTDFALYRNLPAILISPVRVGACITRVLDQTQYPAVSKITPHQLAVPGPAVGALRELKTALCKTLHNRIGAAGLEKDVERQRNGAANFSVGIHDDAILIVVGISDGQRMAQFPLLCLVEFTAEEAPAQKMQLRLRHCALEPQQQPIVEVRRVVAAIRIDHQGVRQRAQLEKAVPVEVRARQSRHLQGKHCPHLAHRHVGHQRLEVLPARHLSSRYAQIPIQCPDRWRRPSQRQRFVAQRILTLRTLLVVAYLGQRRLPDVNVRRPTPVFHSDRCAHR